MKPKWEDDWTSDVNYEALCNVIEDSIDPDVVLDLGCGYGRWLCGLAKRSDIIRPAARAVAANTDWKSSLDCMYAERADESTSDVEAHFRILPF